jgi:hypothetical protein
MKVVVDTANCQRLHAILARDAANVGPKARLNLVGHESATTLRADDGMKQAVGE